MVEIAISISIIAVALVAIAGVLPAGMQVQRENREETIVVEDGKYFLEAIRNGNAGVFNLATHVEVITISNITTRVVEVFSRENLGTDWTSERVIGLLSSFQLLSTRTGNFNELAVTAEVKALNGSALEQSPAFDDVAFRYLMEVEIQPYSSIYSRDAALRNGLSQTPEGLQELQRNSQLQDNLYEIRLRMRWPLRPNGTTGNKQLQFSSSVAGTHLIQTDINGNPLNPDTVTGRTLYRFDPTLFTPNP
jgi:hypothetical protein